MYCSAAAMDSMRSAAWIVVVMGHLLGTPDYPIAELRPFPLGEGVYLSVAGPCGMQLFGGVRRGGGGALAPNRR